MYHTYHPSGRGGEGGGWGVADPTVEHHFYSIPILLARGFNVLWWENNSCYQHYNLNTEWGSYPFTIVFPTRQSCNYILSEDGCYIPHHKQTAYVYAPGELNPPSMTRVLASASPPSLFHSSLISAGLLINAYPPLNKGLIGLKRTPTFIRLDLSNLRDRNFLIVARPWMRRGGGEIEGHEGEEN